MRDNPSLHNGPLAVGGDSSKRGVIYAAQSKGRLLPKTSKGGVFGTVFFAIMRGEK